LFFGFSVMHKRHREEKAPAPQDEAIGPVAPPPRDDDVGPELPPDFRPDEVRVLIR
jgi:hypothetical protein